MNTNIEEVVDKFLYSHAVEEGTQDERDLMKEIYNDKSYSVNRSSLIKFLKSSLTQQKEAIEEGKVELLEEYTKFLFDHGYVDDDVFNEEPTPDKEFLNKLDK